MSFGKTKNIPGKNCSYQGSEANSKKDGGWVGGLQGFCLQEYKA